MSAGPLGGLRPVRDDDAAALIELIGQTWAEYPGVVLDVDAEEPWMRAPAASFAEWGGAFWVLPRPGSRRLDACVGVRPARTSAGVGLIGAGPVGVPETEVRSGAQVAVCRDPGSARGVGSGLARQVEQWARERGMLRVELWSDTRFADAHRLYERLGYVRTGRRRELHDLSRSTESEFVTTLDIADTTYPRQ
ncbi:MAG: N-acetyltransferase family protein [Frankiaceae bacterium]